MTGARPQHATNAPRDADPPRGTVGRLLLEDAPRTGAWNMAVDEVLLESAVSGTSSFRWYGWSEPTLSLGWFQDFEEVRRDRRWRSVPVVRRLSGGGALLHDDEWTYACVLAPSHPWAAQPLELYDRVHAVIVAALRHAGWPAHLFGAGADVDPRTASEPESHSSERTSVPASGRDAEPFLCFARRDPRDVVVAGTKIVGSAQRRRRGAVLQHGSILRRSGSVARELPGLYDIAPAADLPVSEARSSSMDDVGAARLADLPIAIAKAIFAEIVETSLSSAELSRIAEVERRVGAGPSRTDHRTSPSASGAGFAKGSPSSCASPD